MFRPNRTCGLRRRLDTFDAYGQPQFGDVETIKCAIVRYDTKTDHTPVRADGSATRGNIDEFKASGRILVEARTRPKWGDILIIDGKVFNIKEAEPRHHVLGHIDHYECDTEKREDQLGDED